MLPGFVERHLLIKHSFDGPHHRFEAVHPEGEGFMWLVVSLLLLVNKQERHVGLENSCSGKRGKML